MAGGYIKLYRSLLDNPIITKPDYFVIWIYILLKASHKEHYQLVGNQRIHLIPGQFPTGRKKISKDLGISENKIYRALNYFENEHQIKQQKNNKFTVITILNWHKYQGNGTTNEQQNEQQIDNKSTTNRQQIDTNKNDKNVKNEKNNIYSILKFWNEKKITVHEGKDDMLNQISIGIKKFGIEKIELAINRYKQILDDKNFNYDYIWRLDKFLKQSNGVPNYLDDGQIWINYKNKKGYELGIQKENDWNETKKAQLAQRDKDQTKDPLYYQALECAKTKNYICNASKDFDICVICDKENLIKKG